MQSILDAINEWIKEILIGAINGNLSTMFGDVNEKVGTIANEVGQTPQGWNANIFSMIQTLSENVIVPIAGLVITYVLCYELISMVTETSAVSNAARLIRIGAPDSVVRTNARRDCTALTNDEWEYLLAARDLDTFKARFARTKYGPLLGHHEYSVLKEGFFHYRCDWCRKWLRFSTDPTLVMLCYVWLARCEVQDLDHIIEGVHYKLPPEDVQPLLVGFDEKD